MKTIYLTMLEAEEGKILKKGNNCCQSVLLRKGETAEGWQEITKEEYEKKEKVKQTKQRNLLILKELNSELKRSKHWQKN